jgi:hypothetical protein
MDKQELNARKAGFLASSVLENPHESGKLYRAWMDGFQEGEEFLKRVQAQECPICSETWGHTPGCPRGAEQAVDRP